VDLGLDIKGNDGDFLHGLVTSVSGDIHVNATGGIWVLGSNTMSASEVAVQVLYLNAVGRAGTRAELDGWGSNLAPNATALSPAVVAGIEGSPGPRDRLVQGWYQTFLGRPANGVEEQGFVSLLLNGASEEQVLSILLGSQEFFDHAQALVASGTADERFVKALYQLLLGRPGSSDEVTGWIAVLPQMGRQGVALSFLSSPEYRSDIVGGYYRERLHRSFNQTEVDAWVFSNLDLFHIRVAIESSPEYFNNA
jgi:hypothetical protein